MRIIYLAFPVAFITNPSWSQEDLLACVNPDVRASFLELNFGQGGTITREMPEQFSDFSESADFEFVASSDSSYGTSAAFKTGLNQVESMDAAVAILEAAGWADPGMPMGPGGGFVTEFRPQFRMLCRENEMVNVMVHTSGESRFLRLNSSQDPTGITCDRMVSGGAMPMPRSAEVARHLPSLTLPEGVEPMGGRGALIASGGFSGGSDREMSFATTLDTDQPAENLFDHFEPQLQDQGWIRESEWSGESSSGSTWTATPTDEMELSGLLEIVALSESGYYVSFRALSLAVE